MAAKALRTGSEPGLCRSQGLRRAEFHAERRGADRRRRWSAAIAARRQGRGAKFGKRKDGESADGDAAQERVARHEMLPSGAGQGGATDLNGFRRRTFGRSGEGRRSARRGAAVWPRRDKRLRRRRPRREIVFDATDRKNGVRRRRRAPADLAERAGASVVIQADPKALDPTRPAPEATCSPANGTWRSARSARQRISTPSPRRAIRASRRAQGERGERGVGECA